MDFPNVDPNTTSYSQKLFPKLYPMPLKYQDNMLDQSISNQFPDQIHFIDNYIKIPNISNYKYEPLEKFDEYVLYDNDGEALLKKGAIRGFSKWHEQNTEIVWKECIIWEYNKIENNFLIQWPNTNTFKKVIDDFRKK